MFLDYLLNSFGISEYISFLVGILAVHLWLIAKGKFHNWRHNDDRPVPHWGPRGTVMVAVVVALAGSVLVGLQSERTSYQVRAVSENVQRCHHEFEADVKIADEIDELSRRHRGATAELVAGLMAPPPDIAELAIDDPRRRAYNTRISEKYLAIVRDVQAKEAELDRLRAGHPIPADCE